MALNRRGCRRAHGWGDAETYLEHCDSREVDALAMSEPVPAYEFDQRVNW